MSDVIVALDRDHENIAKLLDLLESEVLAIEVGKTPDYPLLQDIMYYMTHYPDQFHHPKEDLIFERLLIREPGVRADVEELLKEHISITQAGKEFHQLVRTSVVDSVDVREQVGTTGIAYIRSLREHMLKESTKLFALAKVIFTREDWQIIEEQVDAIEDPLFGTMVADEYQRLYRLIVNQSDKDNVIGL